MYRIQERIIFWFSFVMTIVCCMGLEAQPLADSSAMQVDLEEVVVSGSFLPIGQSESLYKIEIIDAKQIEQQGATRLDELLKQQLNMRQAQDGILGSQLSLQGLSGKYVQVLIDGVPLIGRLDGQLDLARINLQDVERVEIIEGPMSTVYGNNALAGTINIITKKYQWTSLEGNFSSMAESVGRYNAQASLGGRWKKWSAKLGYEFFDFNGFSTDTLRSQSWNPKQQQHWNASLSWSPDFESQLRYSFRYLDERIEDLGNLRLAVVPELAYAYDNQFLTRTMDHQLAYQGRMKELYYWNAFVAFNQYDRQNNAYTQPLLENEDPLVLDSLNSDTSHFYAAHARILLASAFQKKWDFQLGADLRYEWGLGARLGDSAQIGDYAILANLRYLPKEGMKLQMGLRYAYNSLYNYPLVGNLNFYWNFNSNWTLRASYARGFRAPDLKELYLDFVDSNHFIKGNPDLEAERSHHLRLAVDYQKKVGNQYFQAEADAFYNHIYNQISLIDFQLDSLGNYEPSTGTNQFTYFNLEQFQTLGGQFKLNYKVGGLSLRLGAILTGRFNALYEEYEGVEPFSYTLEFNQQLTYDWPKYGWSFSLFRKDYDKLVRYSTTYNLITDENELLEYFVGGYALMDVSMQKSFLKRNLRLNFGVKNILNVQDVNQFGTVSGTAHGSALASIPTAMGRIFFIQLKYQFNANFSKDLSLSN